MRDGRAYKTNLDSAISYHAGGTYNPRAIGICFQGDLAKNPPTGAQVAKGLLVVRRYASAYNIPPEHIIGHNDAMSTTCPGALWFVDWLRVALTKGVQS